MIFAILILAATLLLATAIVCQTWRDIQREAHQVDLEIAHLQERSP